MQSTVPNCTTDGSKCSEALRSSGKNLMHGGHHGAYQSTSQASLSTEVMKQD